MMLVPPFGFLLSVFYAHPRVPEKIDALVPLGRPGNRNPNRAQGNR
jgi:hypothetical protein